MAHHDLLHRRNVSIANGAKPTWKWLTKATIMLRLPNTVIGGSAFPQCKLAIASRSVRREFLI
jgi:hypothetical protein